jgi:hypothetical protein
MVLLCFVIFLCQWLNGKTVIFKPIKPCPWSLINSNKVQKLFIDLEKTWRKLTRFSLDTLHLIMTTRVMFDFGKFSHWERLFYGTEINFRSKRIFSSSILKCWHIILRGGCSRMMAAIFSSSRKYDEN